MKIRITALDALFSKVVRIRDHWTCRRCGKVYKPPTNGLHCAHIFTRSKLSTRFDLVNAVALCYGCHSFLDRNPLDKYQWYISHCGGEDVFSRLSYRSNQIGKIDRAALKLQLQRTLQRLERSGES